MHNPGGPGHRNAFSLGFHHMPSNMGPISNQLHCSRHPASRQSLYPECLLFHWYEICVQPENNSVTAHICEMPAEDKSMGLRETAGGHQLLGFLRSAGHTCLWPMLWNKGRPPTLLLLLNLAHYL